MALSEVYGVQITVLTDNPASIFFNTLTPRTRNTEHMNQPAVLTLIPPLLFEPTLPTVQESSSLWVSEIYNETSEIDPADLILGDMIGRGSDSEVYLARFNGFLVCAKVCFPRFFQTLFFLIKTSSKNT